MAETSVYRGRPEDAAEDALGAARRALQIEDKPLAASSLDLFAASAAARGDLRRAAVILAATGAAREAMGVAPDEDEETVRAKALDTLRAGGSVIDDVAAEGRGLDLEAALEVATAA
jgi:hypothetical protein